MGFVFYIIIRGIIRGIAEDVSLRRSLCVMDFPVFYFSFLIAGRDAQLLFSIID